MKIVAHSLVKNEENWIWYSLMSVIEHVDQIMVWDTASTDNTVDIVKSIKDPKIKFHQTGDVNPSSFTHARQLMLERTNADWLMLIDGDEIWPEESILKTIEFIYKNGNDYEYLVHPHYNMVGDVFHIQASSAGKYKIGEHSGHINIRFMNLKLLPSLHFDKPHGQQGLFDNTNTLIQNRNPNKSHYLNFPYLHATHLHRSRNDSEVMKRKFKFKFDYGLSFPKSFVFPKVFYTPRPQIVPNVWNKSSISYRLTSLLISPIVLLKRKFLNTPDGY